jgi:hypothetical protein
MPCHLFELNVETTCTLYGSSKNPESRELQLDELPVASSPGRVINDNDNDVGRPSLVRQGSKTFRRENISCSAKQQEEKPSGWSSSIFSVPSISTSRRSNASSGRTSSRKFCLSLSQNALMSAFQLPQILGDSKLHTLRIKCCSWSTETCNHEAVGLRDSIVGSSANWSNATPLRSNFNPPTAVSGVLPSTRSHVSLFSHDTHRESTTYQT